MDGVLGGLVTAVGVVLIGVALRDIFNTIWHPDGRGRVSRRLMLWVWRLGRRGRRRSRLNHLTGPVAMALVVLAWLVLLVVGFALVYWPQVPSAFVYGSGIQPGSGNGAGDALYLSAVTLGTLGFGDIVPERGWLRVAVPVQALVGFALLTAAVSWVLQINPALTRRRALAVRLSLFRRMGSRELLGSDGSRLAPTLLADLAGGIVQARVDLTQYAETYFFGDEDEAASLPAMLGVALHLADEAQRSTDPDTCSAGELLHLATEDYLSVVEEDFLDSGGSLRERCDAYAADHGHSVGTAW